MCTREVQRVVGAMVVGLGVLWSASYASAQGPGPQPPNPPLPRQELAGAWLLLAEPRVPNLPAITQYLLVTFNVDGTLIETAENHVEVRTGHGVWAPSGDRTFATTLITFGADRMAYFSASRGYGPS
jgi:hypothetical protein